MLYFFFYMMFFFALGFLVVLKNMVRCNRWFFHVLWRSRLAAADGPFEAFGSFWVRRIAPVGTSWSHLQWFSVVVGQKQ